MGEIAMLSLIILGVVDFILFISVAMLWVEVKAMQKSTHRLTYINPFNEEQSEPFKPMTEEQKKKLTEDPFDNVM